MGSFFVKLINFVKSKFFLINLLLILAVVLTIIFGTIAYLNGFTHFGEKIEVPDFVGDKVNIVDIEDYLIGKEIGYEVLDSVYRTDIPSGTIFFQQPGPTSATGVHVKQGRKIKFRVATHFRLVEMPALAGKTSKRFAEQKLLNRGLLPVIEFESSSEGKDQVLEQKYKGKSVIAGDKVPVGSKIVLVVSKGASYQTSQVPNLIGFTISQAKERLSFQNIAVNVICDDCPDLASNEGAFIYQQSPEAGDGSVVPEGGTITVWASMTSRQVD